jgi:hypothetical protein
MQQHVDAKGNDGRNLGAMRACEARPEDLNDGGYRSTARPPSSRLRRAELTPPSR